MNNRPNSSDDVLAMYACGALEGLAPAKAWSRTFPNTPLAVRMGGTWSEWDLVGLKKGQKKGQCRNNSVTLIC